MSFFNYLIKNGLWYFIGFIAFVCAFVWVSGFFGPLSSGEVKIVAVCLLVLAVVFVVGNFVAYRKIK